jgi:hypothetical protein
MLNHQFTARDIQALRPQHLQQLLMQGQLVLKDIFDEEGKAVYRGIAKPYKPVTTFKKPGNMLANNAVWTDWLLAGNWDKYHELCRKHFGNESQMWFDREPKVIESWLSDYMGKPLTLVEIQHHINASSWHHVWFFSFNSK